MQRRHKISLASAGGPSALLVFSICAVQYEINLPQCGADEGHMRELIGYLVARGGAEQAAAPMPVGVQQRILCERLMCERLLCEHFQGEHFPDEEGQARRARATIDAKSTGTGTAFARISIGGTNALTESVPIDSASTGTPITISYVRKCFPRDAIAEIAGALPRFRVFD
jgi:hypothetical protein